MPIKRVVFKFDERDKLSMEELVKRGAVLPCVLEKVKPMQFFKHIWLWFLARFRLSESAVCEMSKGRGMHDDFHDFPDSTNGGLPWHFYDHECKRCGKKFTI